MLVGHAKLPMKVQFNQSRFLSQDDVSFFVEKTCRRSSAQDMCCRKELVLERPHPGLINDVHHHAYDMHLNSLFDTS